MEKLLVEGQLFEQGSAASETVTIVLCESGHLVLEASHFKDGINEHIDDVRVSAPLGNTPRELTFPSGQLFVFQSQPSVNQWLNHHGHRSSVHLFETSKKITLLATLAVPLFIFVIYKFAIPAFALHFSALVPQSIVSISSSHTLSALDRTLLDPSDMDDVEKEALIASWQTQVAAIMGPDKYYRILLRKSETMGANAFALPDGTIVITDELVELMESHQDALFAIILHEIGHVELHHAMRYIAETLAMSIVINYMLGDFSALIDLFVGTGATIASNQYSQKLEWQADNFALDKLKANGRDPADFAKAMSLFLTLHKDSSLDSLFSSHPLLKERMLNAESRSQD